MHYRGQSRPPTSMRPQVSVKVLSPTFASRPLVAYRQANFYRATLCVSAVFAVARCLSVRLSRRWITIQIAEDIVKLLSRPGSAIILVCVPERRYPIPSGTQQQGRKSTRGEFCDFRLNRRLSPKRYEIGPWLLWNVNRKSYVADDFTATDNFGVYRNCPY